MSTPVSVFCCGVQKGGTTSLHAYFLQHPALLAPSRKEIHFFDDESQDWAAPDYTMLDTFFPDHDGRRMRFDITPIYGFWPPSLGRIRAYNPASRLIFLFRDPFDRAWSQWCMEFARGAETLPFADAIRDGRGRLDGLPPLAHEQRVYSYVERGRYAEQVRRALRHFPSESLLFLRSEDLLCQRHATLARIAGFLGIAPFPDTGEKREHRRPEIAFPSVPTNADRQLVADELRDDLCQFAALSGLDVSGWPTLR
ncbi:sulfotransferase family protein [Methylorubrum extorquens]